jgi:hypothetical protein
LFRTRTCSAGCGTAFNTQWQFDWHNTDGVSHWLPESYINQS